MAASGVNVCLLCRGKVFGLPASLSIASVDKELLVAGGLKVENQSMKGLLKRLGFVSLPDSVTSSLSILEAEINLSADFICQKEAQLVAFTVESAGFMFVRKSGGMLFALRFDAVMLSEKQGAFSLVGSAARNLGVQKLNFMLGSGGAVGSLPRHISARIGNSSLAASGRFDTTKPFFSGDFDLTGGSPLTTALHKLTGIDTMTLQAGYQNGGLALCIECPHIRNKVLESKNLSIYIAGGAGISLKMQGSFIFSLIPQRVFAVSSDISPTRFLVAGSMQGEAIKLFGPFSIGNVSLLIGSSNGGLTFGMACEIIIGEINLFGAFVITVTASGAPEIQMLSGAVNVMDGLTMASLITNFTGLNVEGVSWLEIIRIHGFGLETKGTPDMDKIKTAYPELGKECRVLIGDKAGPGGDDDFQLRECKGGYTLTDNANMRHYAIRTNGAVSLQAQFYYADTNIQMGAMRIERGLFFCGVIEIWKKRISIYFYMEHGKKIMAFTHIDPIRLGFLELTASSFSSNAPQKMPPCPFTDALVKRGQEKGAMFYFRAESKQLDFYLDGRLKIAGIFEVDARVVYSKANVSIDVRFNLFGCFLVSLQVRAQLSDFNNSRFAILFIVDTTGLEKRFKAVSNALGSSIEKCKKTFDSATAGLRAAQNKVRGLEQETAYLRGRIADCRSEYKRAPWYKKVPVGIKVGVLIAGFEVAILGVKTAMGLALGALKLAEAAVKGVGKAAEGVLKAAKALVDNILKLFYIRRFAFMLDANSTSPVFAMEMEFVILGRTVHLQKGNMGSNLSNQEEVYKSIESDITKNKEYKQALNEAEKGNLPVMNLDRMNEEFDLDALIAHFGEGLEMQENSNHLMRRVQDAYFEEFGEKMDMHEEMDNELLSAIDEVTRVTEMSNQMVDEEILQKLSELELDTANNAGDLQGAVRELRRMNGGMRAMVQNLQASTGRHQNRDTVAGSNPSDPESTEGFYRKVNQAMTEYALGHTYGDNYINIARELAAEGVIEDPLPMDRNEAYTFRLRD